MDNVWCRRFCFQVKKSRRMKVFLPEFLHQGEQRFENNGFNIHFLGNSRAEEHDIDSLSPRVIDLSNW